MPSPNVFLSEELAAWLKKLGPEHKLARWISSMSDTLKENRYAGELIQRRQIPSYYVQRFGVNNLYRYSHPEGYRSCYSARVENAIHFLLECRDKGKDVKAILDDVERRVIGKTGKIIKNVRGSASGIVATES